MYKILALNSVTNAFFLSFIDILGVKFSEYQMVSVGILSAMAFSAISHGKALAAISKQRPLTTIFSRYIFGSIAGQSLVHIGTFVAAYRIIPLPEVAVKFVPSIMNTVLFIISCSQTVSAFTCNYIGRPFRENITENKLIILSLGGLVGFVFNTVLGFHEGLNTSLGVLAVGRHAPAVIGMVAVDSLLSYAVERLCFTWFMLQ